MFLQRALYIWNIVQIRTFQCALIQENVWYIQRMFSTHQSIYQKYLANASLVCNAFTQYSNNVFTVHYILETLSQFSKHDQNIYGKYKEYLSKMHYILIPGTLSQCSISLMCTAWEERLLNIQRMFVQHVVYTRKIKPMFKACQRFSMHYMFGTFTEHSNVFQ